MELTTAVIPSHHKITARRRTEDCTCRDLHSGGPGDGDAVAGRWSLLDVVMTMVGTKRCVPASPAHVTLVTVEDPTLSTSITEKVTSTLTSTAHDAHKKYDRICGASCVAERRRGAHTRRSQRILRNLCVQPTRSFRAITRPLVLVNLLDGFSVACDVRGCAKVACSFQGARRHAMRLGGVASCLTRALSRQVALHTKRRTSL